MYRPSPTIRSLWLSSWSLLFLLLPNWSHGQCTPDTEPPTFTCDNFVNVSLGGFPPSDFDPNTFLDDPVIDNCDTDVDLQWAFDGIPFTGPLWVDCGDLGWHIMTCTATDDAGNSSTCSIDLLVDDKLPPLLFCRDTTTVYLSADGELLATPDIFLDTLIDNCPTDSIGYSYESPAGGFVDSLIFSCSHIGEHPLSIEVFDPNGVTLQTCSTFVIVQDTFNFCAPFSLSGQVYQDNSENCQFDPDESGIGPIDLLITNLQDNAGQTIATEEDGTYTFNTHVSPNTPIDFAISPQVPDFATTCGDPLLINTPIGSASAQLDIPVQITDECPYLQVDIGTPFFTRCQDNTIYVSYCNYSLLDVANASLDVTLDSLFTFISSSQPPFAINGNVVTFDLGDLNPLDCGTITLVVNDLCTSVGGQTLCVEAHIFPDEICQPLAGPNWTGASVIVEGTCDNGQAKFSIQNVGTGDMNESRSFIIVEDVVMYSDGQFDLDIDETYDIDLPGNGSTWRVEAQQATDHPGLYQPVAWLEGCGGINNNGMVNVFAVSNTDPFQAILCEEVLAPFDPNDKRGFPTGRGDDHIIAPNQDLKYVLRFQNIGTAPAQNVIIQDTLSPLLNYASVEVGASSHPYHFTLSPEGILSFQFLNINLPDSTSNPEASQGFVNFRVAQQPNLADGEVIYNQASIYFDAEAPVATNQTWHTIGEPKEEMTNTVENSSTRTTLSVYPNPAISGYQVVLPNLTNPEGRWELYDVQGRLVQTRLIQNTAFWLPTKDLGSGIYFYKLQLSDQQVLQGKLIIE